MEVQLAGGLLPLLLLAWLPTGLAHQTSATINVSVGLDVFLQCLPQNSTTAEVEWFNITRNNGEKQNKSEEMEERSTQLLFHTVGGAHTRAYTCRMESTGTMFGNGHSDQKPGKKKQTTNTQSNRKEGPREEKQTGIVSQPKESGVLVKWRLIIWSENLAVRVEWYKPAGQIDTVGPGENCTELASSGESAASTGIYGCRVFVTRINSTDTGNSTQEAVPACDPGALQTNVTEKETWTGLHCPWCIIFGLAVGTLLYMPVICFLLWQRRKKRKGKLTSRQVAEENQLSTAAPVTGTEDLTYANLKFENKGTKPASSDIVYTEIKPLQQQQKSGDAGAADTGVDVSPEGDGK